MLDLLVERRSLTQHDLDSGLWYAAFAPTDAEGVKALLEAGASLHGDRLLLASVCFGHRIDHDAGVEAVIDALIDAGLDPNDQDENGFTPLLTALGPDTFGLGYQESDGYNRPAALALVRRGAEVNIRYPETDVRSLEDVVVVGFTPLHLAARVGDGQVVRALLDAGADPTAQTPGGRTALELARAQLEAMTGPDATPPPAAAEGASDWKIRSAPEERRRWDEFVSDALVAVDLLAGTTRPRR
jgi:ankyrin repeat protein